MAGRKRENRDAEIIELYEYGFDLEMIAKLTNLTTQTIRTKLISYGVYDPPLTKHFLKIIWPEWKKACDRLRRT